MTEEEKSKKAVVYFPSIPPRAPPGTKSYPKAVQDAPYRALVGVVIDGKIPERPHDSPRYRVRRQTGLTNRWRLPESLYSDLLGSSQALKSINMPFNQTLVKQITGTYPTCNSMLVTCPAYAYMNPKYWSLLNKQRKIVPPTEDDDDDSHSSIN